MTILIASLESQTTCGLVYRLTPFSHPNSSHPTNRSVDIFQILVLIASRRVEIFKPHPPRLAVFRSYVTFCLSSSPGPLTSRPRPRHHEQLEDQSDGLRTSPLKGRISPERWKQSVISWFFLNVHPKDLVYMLENMSQESVTWSSVEDSQVSPVRRLVFFQGW